MSTDDEEKNFMLSIAGRLKEERNRLNILQEDIAKVCETTARTVVSWEDGQKIPSHQLARMITAGVDAIYVLTGVRTTCDSGAIPDREEKPSKEGKSYKIKDNTNGYYESHLITRECDSGAIIARESHQKSAEIMPSDYALVPLYDVEVSAGHGSLNGEEQVIARIAFLRSWLSKVGLYEKDLAAVRARGDSMEPTLGEGDLLLIDMSQRQPGNGHIYIMSVQGGLIVKRLQIEPSGDVRVISDNKLYPDTVAKLEGLEVLGRVVWQGRLL